MGCSQSAKLLLQPDSAAGNSRARMNQGDITKDVYPKKACMARCTPLTYGLPFKCIWTKSCSRFLVLIFKRELCSRNVSTSQSHGAVEKYSLKNEARWNNCSLLRNIQRVNYKGPGWRLSAILLFYRFLLEKAWGWDMCVCVHNYSHTHVYTHTHSKSPQINRILESQSFLESRTQGSAPDLAILHIPQSSVL